MNIADTLKSMLDGVIKNPIGALNSIHVTAGLMKSAAVDPSAALSGFLLSLAHAMGHELSINEANTLARMTVRTIMRGKKV